MKGFRLNPDKKYVDIIMNGLERKNGHCPCRLEDNETTLCPCDEFVSEGICKCKLYIPFEEAEEVIRKKGLDKESNENIKMEKKED